MSRAVGLYVVDPGYIPYGYPSLPRVISEQQSQEKLLSSTGCGLKPKPSNKKKKHFFKSFWGLH